MTGVSEAEIKRHEEWLGSSLPPSYRQFLKVANGWDAMEDPPVYLVPLTKVGWLRDLDPHLVAMWSYEDDPYAEVSDEEHFVSEVSDEEYFVYGNDQETCHLRPEYLPGALQIGENDDGVFLLNSHITT